jgi:DNA-binding CsgD family transcriptional regulator
VVTPPLVARDDELGRLLGLVRTRSGAVVVGDPGVGKTALASALAARHGDSGQVVVWIVATEAGRGMPFAALAPLMPPDVTAVHPAIVPNLVAGRIAELVEASGRRGPPLLVLDDAHQLDEQSAACVLGLVAHQSVRLLATVRSGVPVPDAVTSLWKDGFCERVDLAPLDRDGARALLAAGLGGDVAGATAELLWQHTRGNPLYLTELVRFGEEEGRFTLDGGLWTWQGELGVPPRLAELLERRFDGLSAEAHDALTTIALCEPIRFDSLVAITSDDAVAELESRRLVATVDEGTVWLRFAHPLLGAIAARRATLARRHRLAERLLDVCDWADEVRRASWQLESAGPPDVELLLRAADDVLLTDPGLTARFARRALDHDASPHAAVSLANAYAELGRPAEAWTLLRRARERIRTDDDRILVTFAEVSLTTWSERRPAAALADLRTLRSELPESFHAEIDSAVALAALFAGQTTEALTRAEDVLERRPSHRVAVRASIARVAALALAGRTSEAVRVGEHLLAVIDSQPVTPYATGLAHVATALAYLCRWEGAPVPTSDPSSGRWPVPPRAVGIDVDRPVTPKDSFAWPLLEGVHRHMAGDLAGAVTHLREALVYQRRGEGLFRSEVAAGLAVVLAGLGRPDEAERILAEVTPDAVAVVPGLRSWAEAAVAAARGRVTLAAELAEASAREAGGAGAVVPALWALTDVARYGEPRRAAAYLDELEARSAIGRPGGRVDSPLVAARAEGIRARASGDARALLAAAERHATLGLLGGAIELADLVVAGPGGEVGGTRARAVRLSQRLRDELGLAPPVAAPTLALTRRELEVASLAARGMSDRDIADTLVVSVRTVESHLAAAYRKLGISSRRELAAALAPAS